MGKNRCGDDSQVVQMTGTDAEIVCGEWQTGDTAPTLSGERYNIVLEIYKIVRHPNYRVNIESSAYLQNDIAIFKVNDNLLPKEKTERLQVYPACLPLTQRTTRFGFLKVYEDFFKQIHYKMDILEKCEDANVLGITGIPAKFPTNTFYPPGTVCARNFYIQSCFYSGESGSPLMIRDERSSRFYVEGFLSFIKGCSLVALTSAEGATERANLLFQETEEPSIYTKVSCFLPWIADQY